MKELKITTGIVRTVLTIVCTVVEIRTVNGRREVRTRLETTERRKKLR